VRLLADENFPGLIVVWLRNQGHDVLFAAESRSGSSDVDLLTEAKADGLVILTEDKDFGDLIFRDMRGSHGVGLLRMEQLSVPLRLSRLQVVWPAVETAMPGSFLVVTEKHMRRRLLPPP